MPKLENQAALISNVFNGHLATYSSNLTGIPKNVQDYIEEKAKLCQPDQIHICDGSEEENKILLGLLERSGAIQRLRKMDNW